MISTGAAASINSSAGNGAAGNYAALTEVVRSHVEGEPDPDTAIERVGPRGLILTERGRPARTLANALTIMSQHPAFSGVVAYDEFSQQIVKLKSPPMRPQDRPTTYQLGEWTDEDTTRTRAWFASTLHFEPTREDIETAIGAIAHRVAYHPVREWLDKLTWDGVLRIDLWLSRYLGAIETEYIRAVGAKFLIGMIARIYEPGCKLDTVLTLEGTQGIGKSRTLRALTSPLLFSDTPIDFGSKDAYQALCGRWLIEIPELASIKSVRSTEALKAFISSSVDRYRPPYGRRPQDFPRQCIFVGTTNESDYLADQTGNRRFWPVKCTACDVAALEHDREQLFAEAVARYKSGERWWLKPSEECAASVEQEERAIEDPWESVIANWLACPTVPNPDAEDLEARIVLPRDHGITIGDVLEGALGMRPALHGRREQVRVGPILQAYGWHVRGKARPRRYYPPAAEVESERAKSEGTALAAQQRLTEVETASASTGRRATS